MSRRAKIFWGPWVGAMAVACAMILIGGFMPEDALAQATKAQAEKAATKIVNTAKVAATKIAVDSKRVVPQVVLVEVPASMPASQPVAIAPIKPNDPQGTAAVIKGAMHTSNWRLAVIGGLLLAVLLLRRIGGFCLPAKAGDWVNSDRGGATLALAAGVLTVGVNGCIAGGGFNPQLLVDGVLAAATTAGTFNLTKRLVKPSDLPASPPAPAPQDTGQHGGAL
jgi:hypothetical protein